MADNRSLWGNDNSTQTQKHSESVAEKRVADLALKLEKMTAELNETRQELEKNQTDFRKLAAARALQLAKIIPEADLKRLLANDKNQSEGKKDDPHPNVSTHAASVGTSAGDQFSGLASLAPDDSTTYNDNIPSYVPKSEPDPYSSVESVDRPTQSTQPPDGSVQSSAAGPSEPSISDSQ